MRLNETEIPLSGLKRLVLNPTFFVLVVVIVDVFMLVSQIEDQKMHNIEIKNHYSGQWLGGAHLTNDFLFCFLFRF